MPLTSVLRVNTGSWMAIPLLVIAVAFAISYLPAASDPYPIAIASSAMVSLVFVAPICAALGTWEGARFRRARWWEPPHARSRAVIALVAVAPVIVAGSVASVAAIAVKLAVAGPSVANVVPDVRLAAVAAAVIASHVLAGFALGLWAPVVLAAPAALMTSFLWMASPAATDPLWLRHLNGSLATCCLIQQELAPGAVFAALTVAFGLAAAALVMITMPRFDPAHGVVGLLPIALSLAVAAQMAGTLGPDPSVPRHEGDLSCGTGPGVSVCLWPEHESKLAETIEVASRSVAAWQSAGLPTVTRFTEGAGIGRDGASFGLTTKSTEADIIASLAYGLLPPVPACAASGPYPADSVRELIYAWYSAVAGLSNGELERRFDGSVAPGEDEPLAVVRSLRGQPRVVQAGWLKGALEAVNSCGPVAELALPR
jgi:hypothetical protein